MTTRRFLYPSRNRSGRGDPVPLHALTAHDVLQTRIVAGMDEDEITLIRRGSREVHLFPTTECAATALIGGEMSDDNPGTSAGW